MESFEEWKKKKKKPEEETISDPFSSFDNWKKARAAGVDTSALAREQTQQDLEMARTNQDASALRELDIQEMTSPQQPRPVDQVEQEKRVNSVVFKDYNKNTKQEFISQAPAEREPMTRQQELSVQTKTDDTPFMAGLKTYLPQTKQLASGAVMAAGDVIGNEGIKKWGLEKYKSADQDIAPLSAGRPTNLEDIKSIGSAIDWFQYNLGSVSGSIAESAVAAGVGALAGSEVPVAGNIAGGVAGVVAKGSVKKFLAKQVAKEIAKGAEETVAKEIAKKTLQKTIGAGMGVYAHSYIQGVGDTYGETLDDNGNGDAKTAFWGAVPYAAADALGDLFLMGKVLKGSGAGKVLVRYGKAFLESGLAQGAGETIQEAELILAGLKNGKEYSTKEVLSRLGNSFTSAFATGGALGLPGGRNTENKQKNDTVNQDSNEIPPPPPDAPPGSFSLVLPPVQTQVQEEKEPEQPQVQQETDQSKNEMPKKSVDLFKHLSANDIEKATTLKESLSVEELQKTLDILTTAEKQSGGDVEVQDSIAQDKEFVQSAIEEKKKTVNTSIEDVLEKDDGEINELSDADRKSAVSTLERVNPQSELAPKADELLGKIKENNKTVDSLLAIVKESKNTLLAEKKSAETPAEKETIQKKIDALDEKKFALRGFLNKTDVSGVLTLETEVNKTPEKVAIEKPKATESPLHTEARGKSLDEFVKGQTQVTDGVKHLDSAKYNNYTAFVRDIEKLNSDGKSAFYIGEKPTSLSSSDPFKELKVAEQLWGDRPKTAPTMEVNVKDIIQKERPLNFTHKAGRNIDTPVEIQMIDGKPNLVDGRHRLDQARANGQTTISAKVTGISHKSQLTSIWKEANKGNAPSVATIPVKPPEIKKAVIPQKRVKPVVKGKIETKSPLIEETGKGIYQTIHEGGLLKSVEGKPVKIIDGVDTFIHQGDNPKRTIKGFIVSEKSSGRTVGSGETKREAIANAKNAIQNVGETKFKKLVSENQLSSEGVKKATPKSGLPKDYGDKIIDRIKEKAYKTGLIKNVEITNSKIIDRINNQNAPSGVDIGTRTLQINKSDLLDDIKLIESGGEMTVLGKKITNVDDYIDALVNYESNLQKRATVGEAIDLARGGDIAKKTAKKLDELNISDLASQQKKGNKTSGVAKSIEAKAIEQGLIDKGFDELAQFEGTTFKEQADLVSKIEPDQTRAIIKGEQPLPSGVRSAALLSVMEDLAKQTKDADLMYDLANSPLATKISESASEVSLARMREKDSATMKLQEIRNARKARAEKQTSPEKKKVAQSAKAETEKNNLSKDDQKWESFLESIIC